MAHALSWRRLTACDEGCYRFSHIFMNPLCCLFFRIATDFTDHEDCFGIFIIVIKLQYIDEISTFDRVAADADSSGLADTCLGELESGFIGEGAGTGNDAT